MKNKLRKIFFIYELPNKILFLKMTQNNFWKQLKNNSYQPFLLLIIRINAFKNKFEVILGIFYIIF